MKVLSADEFHDVVNETFPHDVISKRDVLELIDEMTMDGSVDDAKCHNQRYEYKIEVCMNPHHWDNKEKPYYWVIFEGNCNAGFGWCETPEQAWVEARQYYEEYHANKT